MSYASVETLSTAKADSTEPTRPLVTGAALKAEAGVTWGLGSVGCLGDITYSFR